MRLIFILLLLLSCQTTPQILDSPKDYSDVIKDVDRQMESVQSDKCVQDSPTLQKKIITLQNNIYKMSLSLKESESNYKKSFDSYTELQKISSTSQKIINEQSEIIEKYRNDFLSPKQKLYLWWIIGLSIIGLLGYTVFILVIKGIIKF